jgi:hypothetical protein
MIWIADAHRNDGKRFIVRRMFGIDLDAAPIS